MVGGVEDQDQQGRNVQIQLDERHGRENSENENQFGDIDSPLLETVAELIDEVNEKNHDRY